jgi:hypothetical protein
MDKSEKSPYILLLKNRLNLEKKLLLEEDLAHR